MSVRLRLGWWLIAGIVCLSGEAKLLRPVPAGILFPMFNQAALVNPSALAKEKATSIQALYSPPPDASQAHQYEGSVATSTKKIGLGIGYLGTRTDAQSTHSAFAGGGAKWNNVSLGMSVQDTDLSDGFQPSLGLGLTANLKEFDIGAVVYDLNNSPRGGVGVGFSNKRYALEGYALLPPFSSTDTSNSPFSVGVGAGIYGQIVAVSFGATYAVSGQTTSNALQFFIAGAAWFSDNFNLYARFDSPQTFTGGITVVF